LFQAEDGIRYRDVTGVQTCALPIWVVLVDLICVDGPFYFLEVNSIPGMSNASIIPQQVKSQGMTVSELLDHVINEALNN